LSPVSTKPLQTINVPSLNGSTQAGPCARIGKVDINFFDTLAMAMLTTLNIPANTLPLFLSYNTFETSGGQCCILGYHSTNNAGTQAYAVAAYSDPGIFSVPIQDIHALSHEIGEWMDDPLIPSTNIVPAWGHVGQVGGCQNNLETADPLAALPNAGYPVPIDGFVFHPQSQVMMQWFQRQSTSDAMDGIFSFPDEGLMTTPSQACPAR